MTDKEKKYYRVLTIAGSDSGGGAGIQADMKTIAAHGCYGFSVITALTAQNTQGVSAIHAVPVDFVRAQLDAVLPDIGCDAVKIGMLFSPELIRTVAEGLQRHGVTRIVLDPVMVAQSGDKLVQDEAIEALRRDLTIVMVAHRLTTLRRCDEIVELAAGRLRGVRRPGVGEDADASHRTPPSAGRLIRFPSPSSP